MLFRSRAAVAEAKGKLIPDETHEAFARPGCHDQWLHGAAWAQARVVLEKKLTGLSALRFGSDYFYSNEKTIYTLYSGQKFSEKVIDKIFAGFAETDVYITNNLAAKVGGRIEHSEVLDKWNIAPRLSLAYKFPDNSQASFAYGIFYQNPERRLLPAIASVDYSKATHYILQYSKQSKDYTFRTEIFYKKYNRLYTIPLQQYCSKRLCMYEM